MVITSSLEKNTREKPARHFRQARLACGILEGGRVFKQLDSLISMIAARHSSPRARSASHFFKAILRHSKDRISNVGCGSVSNKSVLNYKSLGQLVVPASLLVVPQHPEKAQPEKQQ